MASQPTVRSRTPEFDQRMGASQAGHSDPLDRIEGLETVEILKLVSLLGEVANLANADDQQVVRAAAEALVTLDPSVAIGVLVGLVNRSGG